MTEATAKTDFYVNNFDASCPTSGELCPRRERLVHMYTDYADPGVVSAEIKFEDHAKLQIKLGEMTVQAQFRGCEGVTDDGACHTGEAMNNSTTRKTAVDIFRKTRNLLRGK